MKKEIKTNIPLVFLLVTVGLLLGSMISFCMGKYPISLGEIRDLLMGNEVKAMTSKVFFTLRVPRTIMALLGGGCFWLLLGGGISFTIGAVLYGIGKKKKWMHSVFHIFTVIGTTLQFFAIYFYVM